MKKIYFFLLMTLLIGFSTLPISAQQTLTVHNGTTTNGYVPVHGYYADAYLKAEFVIPATELTAIATSNDPIIGMTFYASQSNVSWGNANFQVFLTEVNDVTISSFVGTTNATTVYQGSLSIVNGEMVIEFTTPYTYNGGNLLVGIYNTVEGSYVTSSWYGEDVTGASVQGYSYSDLSSVSATQRNFIPKTTFTYGLITCAKPTAFTATTISTTEVMLNWNGNGTASSYNIEYGPTGFTPNAGIGVTDVAYDTTIIISNLTAGITYDYYVQADCGTDDTSIWVGPISLNTSQYIMPTTGTNSINTCGTIIYDDGGPTGEYSNGCNSTLIVYPATENTVVAITGTNSSEAKSSGGCWDYLQIYDGMGTNGTQLVNSCGDNQVINAISSTGPLTIYFSSDGSTTKAGFELTVTCVSCYAPSNIRATDVTNRTATLSWADSSETGNYIVTLSHDNITETEEIYGQVWELTDLIPSTTYTVQIQTLCDDGDTSMLSGSYSFNTLCEAITVTENDPWTENFEGYTGGGEQPFVCWDRAVTDVYYHGPFVYCGHRPSCYSGTNSAEFKGANNLLVLPPFSNDINTLRLSFWATATDTTIGTVEVGVITDMNDAANSFVSIANVGRPGPRGPSGTTTDGWGKFMGPFDFNGVQTTSGRIALRYTSTSPGESWNLDNFTVSLIPACNAPTPTSVTASNPLGHSATISWTDNDASHNSWMVYYKASTADEDSWQTMPAYTTSAELTGLTPETTYQVYVVTVCEGTEGTDATLTITFETDVACPAPSGITVSNVVTDGATINWLGEADSYTLEYDTSGFTPGNGTIVSNITANSYDLNNLMANTSYTIYVYGDCGVLDSLSQTSSYSFRTACTSVSVTGNPWTENFENSSDDPDCWISALTSTRNGHNFPYVQPAANIAHGGSHALEIAFGNIVTALPQFDEDLSELLLSFWAYNNRYSSSYNSILELGYITNPYDATTFVPTDTLTYTTYTKVVKSFTDLAGLNLPATTRIAFRYNQLSSNNLTSWYIDDMIVELLPDCMFPTNLHVTNVGETEVTLAWTELGTSTGWNIEYGASGFTPGQNAGTLVPADANPYTIENLASGAVYDFYVQADCGSTWDGPVSVVTGQYEMHTEGNDTLTTCGMAIYDDGGPNGDYSINCNSILILYPTNPDAKMSLTGTANIENNYDHLYIYDGAGTNGIQLDHVTGLNRTVDVLSNSGPLTLKFTSDGTVVKTGFELIAQCVSCFPPTSLATSNIGLDEATISWNGNADEYSVCVILNDTTYYTTTDTTLLLSNLMPSSTYRVYVRSICGTDTSALSQAFNFSTSCGLITIDASTPWFENFEGYTGSANTSVPLGSCWATPEVVQVGNGISPFVYLGYAGSAYSGVNTLEMKGSPIMAVLPEFSNDINTLRISFWGNTTASNASDAGYMVLGYISDINDPNSFIAVDTIPATAFGRTGTDSPHANLIGPYDFSGITPQNGLRIALRLTDAGLENTSTGNPHSWNLDDFTVSLIPNCPSPVKNSVSYSNVDGHNATISWIDNDANHDSWTVYYKASGETVWQSEMAGPYPTVDLVGLTPTTEYEVYVVTNCTVPDAVADETNHISFTTTIACPAPTGVATSVTDQSATISWSSTATDFIAEYGPSGTTLGNGTPVYPTGNSVEITGLSPQTNYVFFLQADCGNGDSSTVVTANFTTACEVVSTFDYTESFENGLGCWQNYAVTGTTSWATTSSYNYNSNLPDGNSCVITYNPSYSEHTTQLISPIFDLSALTNPYIKFNHIQTVWASDQDELYVYYKTSATAQPVLLASYTSDISVWQEDSLALPNASSEYQVIFEAHTAYGHGVGLDMITVYDNEGGSTPPTPTCDVPTGLATANVTYNAADVNWTAGGSETAWNLQYKTGTANWTTIPVTAPNYHISGLNAETTYQVRVQANCGDNSTSDWTAAVSFTTEAAPAEPCLAPTNLQVSNLTQNSATLTWTAGGNELSWKVQYKLSTASQYQEVTVSQTSCNIEGLTANSTYDVQVKAVCSEDNMSDVVSTTFTTPEEVGIDNINLAQSISLMPNPAENHIELRVNSNVEVKEAIVYNAFGQLIQTVQLTENHARIDLSNMASGMYFVRVNSESVTATRKFIKR